MCQYIADTNASTEADTKEFSVLATAVQVIYGTSPMAT